MPNFQTKLLNTLKFPHSCDDVEFEWRAKHKNETLILTRYKNESFFIRQIERKKDVLVKGDKLAKPSRVKLLQNALIAYEKATGANSAFSNIHTTKNRHEKHSEFLKNLDFFAKDFREFSKRFELTCIEVGFGSGRHLLHQAAKNPNTLYVGIEIHKPSIEQVVKLCELRELKNVLVVDCDARILMEFFASNSVSKIYVHFPIPWDKKPHRRVISKAFVDESIRVLSENGRLELRTDSEKFFNYSFEVMLSYPHVDMEISKNKNIDISSKYEDRWKKMEKNIYDLTMINREISLPKDVPCELSFPFKISKNKIKKETHLKDNWFVHFETCYNIDKENFLWRVAFGDTAHVEHCYISILDREISYFPKNLYATKSNLLAHKYICERLI